MSLLSRLALFMGRAKEPSVVYYVLFEGDHLYIDCTDDMHSGVEDWADSGVIFLSKDLADKKAEYMNRPWPFRTGDTVSVHRFVEVEAL